MKSNGTAMEFVKNGKKAKNGALRKDKESSEQLLIAYSGGEQGSDTDSDRHQPLELPPTRLRRPKSRKIHVTSSTPKSCCSLLNICQVLFVVVIIGMMVCMVWFTFILKTSLDSMKKRVVQLETSDRSTAKECADKTTGLQKNLEALRGGESDLISIETQHFKSILKQIAHLNKTVAYLRTKLKSPRSASAIQKDIGLLKVGMADMNNEMTEVRDKVKQLRKIAHLQNINLKVFKQRIYNISFQLAKMSGQPTPRPIINTATPSWLLRVPADNGNPHKKGIQQLEAEKLRRNITSHMNKEIGKVLGAVSRVNGTLLQQVRSVQARLTLWAKNVSRHMSVIDKMIKREVQARHKSSNMSAKSVPTLHGDADGELTAQVSNLTSVVDQLMQHMDAHNRRFSDLSSDMVSINHTLYEKALRGKPADLGLNSCNCSQPLGELRNMLAKDKTLLQTLRTDLDSLKRTLKASGEEKVSSPSPDNVETPATEPTPPTTGNPTVKGISTESAQSDVTTESPTTAAIDETGTPTTRGKRKTTTSVSEENALSTALPVTPGGEKTLSAEEPEEDKELTEGKRMTDDDSSPKDETAATNDQIDAKDLFEDS